MKKFFTLMLVLALAFSFAACGNSEKTAASTATPAPTAEPTPEPTPVPTPEPTSEPTEEPAPEEEPAEEAPADEVAEDVAAELMTYAEYAAAEIDTPVCVETYVQAHQSWWDGKVTVYSQDADGAYFIYNMACSEEDAAKLVPGTKIKVTGYKAEWSGEIEIVDATFDFVDGDSFIAEATDVTDLLGTDDLIAHQNQFVSCKGMTVEAYDDAGNAFAYKNETEKTDDLYFKLSKDGKTYEFCVEYYLCGNDTDVYKAVEALKVGDVVDLEGFLYWYEGANLHTTGITAAA